MFLIEDVSLVQWGDCHEFGEIIVMHIRHLGNWFETLVPAWYLKQIRSIIDHAASPIGNHTSLTGRHGYSRHFKTIA